MSSGRVGSRAVIAALAALVVYAVALLFERYGVRSSVHGADVTLYRSDARAIAAGRLPYRDLYFEYPPGVLPPLLAPEPASDYAAAFKALMAVLGAGTLLIGAGLLRGQRGRLASLLAIAVAPLAVGSVFVNRYDVWPTLLLVAGLALLVRGRPTAASVMLGLGTVAKIFPAAAVPVAAVWIWRTHGSDALKRAAIAFVATVLVVLLPFAAIGLGGLRFSFTIQLTRHLQTESLGGAILLVAGRLGLYHPTIAIASPGSLDLFGTLPTVLATCSVLLVVALVAWIAWDLSRGELDTSRLVAGVAAAVAVYVAFGKVLSPQYLIWLVPLVPLVRRGAGAAATAVFTAALVLTQVEFDYGYAHLESLGWSIWPLLARNLLLVVLAGLLVRAVRAQRVAGGSQTSSPSLRTSR